jgi:VWFA-related protein
MRALVLASIGIATLTLSAQTSPTPQTPPAGQTVFRSGTLLIPVDVRVLDNKGLPVRDLTAKDFRIFEDGTLQEIRQFSAVGLTPSVPDPTLPLRPVGTPSSIATQNRRLFLIVLGRGRLQGPSKGLDALQDFIRNRMLPQDLVALMAWNRATDFTPDHEKIATVIERFRTRHEEIETDLRLILSGLSGLYAGRQIPRPIQVKIDDVFNVPQAGTREVVPTTGTARAQADVERDAQRKSEIEARAAAYRQFNTSDRVLGELMAGDLGTNFDEYIALSRQTLQDVGNVYAGIDYLRFIDGEKHLLLVTEQGFLLPSADHDRDIASLASDARVAIDTFQTGGVAVSNAQLPPVTNMASNIIPSTVGQPPPVLGAAASKGFALSALRKVSEASGGQTSISERGTAAIDRLVHSTEYGYLLGYTPTNTNLDGKFRKIKVELTRKGSKLSFRSGYFARPAEAFDPRKAMATTRMVAAANYAGDVGDLRLSVRATDVKGGKPRSVDVETIVPVDRLVFARNATGAFVALSQAVMCLDTHGDNVGEIWRTLEVAVPAENYDDVRKNGLKLTVNVPVTISPQTVRVIIYDYGSDLLGSTKIKRF